MKRLKQILAVVALVFCCSMVAKADTKAAQITGVKQTGDSSSSIYISCNAELGTSNYVVELSTNNQKWLAMGYSNKPDNIYINGLSAGQTYYARIVGASKVGSKNAEGGYDYTASTTPSAPIEVVTRPNVQPKAVLQSNATTTQATVTITPADGANYYKLIADGVTLGEGASTTLSTVSTLKPGTRYWTHVYACRKANTGYIATNSSYSSSASLYLKTLRTKMGKNDFALSWVSVGSNSFRFTANSNGYIADGYQFQLLNASGQTKKTLVTKNSSTYIYANNLAGTFYQYRARAYINCGTKSFYSAWSDTKTFAYAKQLKYKYVKGKLKANWSKVNGATKYIVYASNKENSGYKKIKTLNSAKKRNITISKIKGKKLKKGRTYYIKVLPVAKKLKANAYGAYACKYYKYY